MMMTVVRSEVAAGTKLNSETKDTYMVTVKAETPSGPDSSTIDVTIMVTGQWTKRRS